MNITVGIFLKLDPCGLQQKCIPGDFPQFVKLPLLRTYISGCFQSAREAADSSLFKVKLCENSKSRFFPKRALRVSFWSLSFGLSVSFIFLQGYRKV